MSPTNPDRSIGFLMHDVARLMRRAFNRKVQETGLTEAGWRVIAHLYRQQGVNQTTLAGILEVQPISLGRLIDRMEQAGFVERRADPSDRRAVALYLTDKALPHIQILTETGANLRETATKGLSETEQERLIDMLLIMRANLNSESQKDD